MAIAEQAQAPGSHVDDELVDVLLAVCASASPGPLAQVLPLLSLRLDQAWRFPAGTRLPSPL